MRFEIQIDLFPNTSKLSQSLSFRNDKYQPVR
jgi:hypothetical protein